MLCTAKGLWLTELHRSGSLSLELVIVALLMKNTATSDKNQIKHWLSKTHHP